MKRSTWVKLERLFERRPRMRGESATDEDIGEAERVLDCVFHPDYRLFLKRYGSALVGPDPIYGVRPCPTLGTIWSVVAQTRRFREEGWPGVDEWYVMSLDGRGNPIGMDSRGRVWMSDHDVGDMPLLARSFEKYLLKQLATMDD